MTATSTNPSDSVVYLTAQVTGSGPTTYEQGSGVLIAPDEVLTAAHLIYNAQGQLNTNVQVSPGYQGQSVYGVVSAKSIHAMPFTDYSVLAGAPQDFAIIHLATPITNVPVMALGADFTGGPVTVSGYPVATAGQQDSLQETVTQVAGYDALQGTALGAPGDSRGASGGPVWETVNGVPTVVGLTASESGSTGYFVRFTSADVAQIQTWMAQDQAEDATEAQQLAAVQTAGSGTTQSATAAAPSAGAQTANAIAFVSGDADNIRPIATHGYIDHATSRVVALLTRDAAALGTSASFDDVAALALSQLGDNGQSRNLAASLLEGLVWGHDGGAPNGTVAGIVAQDPGIASYTASQQSAHAGALLGHALLTHGF